MSREDDLFTERVHQRIKQLDGYLAKCKSELAITRMTLEDVKRAHGHIETANMPAWLENVEDALDLFRGNKRKPRL